MDDILESLGLEHLKEKFTENKVTAPKDVLNFTESDFTSLGVICIGDRSRLRAKCREAMQEDALSSPVVLRLKARRANRRKRCPQTSSANPPEVTEPENTTYKLYAGWKHRANPEMPFTRVTLGKGGGTHKINVSCNATLAELTSQVTYTFFPEGKNNMKGVDLQQVSLNLATFSGSPLPEILEDGSPFTVHGYVKQKSTHPVRVYVETTDMSAQSDETTHTAQDADSGSPTTVPENMSTTHTAQDADSGSPTTVPENMSTTHTAQDADSGSPTTVSENMSTTHTAQDADSGSPTTVPENMSTTHTAQDADSGSPTTVSENMSTTHTAQDADSGSPTTVPENMSTTHTAQDADSGSPTTVPENMSTDSGTPTVVFNWNARQAIAIDTLPDLDIELPDIRTRPPPTPVWVETDNFNMSSLKDVILHLQENVVVGAKNIINVDREDVISGAIIGFRRQRFDEWRGLDVKFSGERGIDGGGPTREFMRLCMSSIQRSSIFEGDYKERNLALDYCALTDGKYQIIGKLMAYIIVHGGPLPSFMAESFFKQIASGWDSILPCLQDIYDLDLRRRVQQVMDAADNTEFLAAVDDLNELIHLSGTVRLSLSIQTKSELAFALIKFIVLERKREPFKQFLSGLECCGLLPMVQIYPDICQPMFVYTPQKLDANLIDNMLEVEWSEPGSNRHRMELRTQTHFRNWLQDCEDCGVLERLLVFFTGLDVIPPTEFCTLPTLAFSLPEDFEPGDHRAGFPIANTCCLKLTIPIISSYELFSEVMSNCINTVTTFTNE